MKLIFLLALVACANSAKLDRTYLPPNAQTSGGSANILDTPNFEPSPFQATPQGSFGQRNRGQETQTNFAVPQGVAQNGPAARGQAAPQGNFAQDVNNFSQNGPAARGQAAPQGNIAQDVNNFAQNGPLPRGQAAPQGKFAQCGNNFANTPVDRGQIVPQGNYAQPNQDNFAQQPAANAPFNPLAETTFANEGSGFAPSNIAQPNFANDDSVAIDNFEANPGNFESNPGNFESNPGNFVASPGNFERPERPRASLDRNAAILRMDSSNDGETYAYAYETENGIAADESGVATNGVEAQGGFSYTGDDGQVYSIRYTADQNGFVPVGDHLPTPPPVPEEILKALEKNARDEANGIFDDGSYNAEKYGTTNEQPSQQFGNNNYPSDNNFNGISNENPSTGNFAQDSGNFSPDSGNFAPGSGNFAPDSGNFAPDSGNIAPDSGNFAPGNSFDQTAIAPENQGSNSGNTEAFPSNFANKVPSSFAQEDEDSIVTNSAAEFPSFANQRSQPSRGSAGSNGAKGPAYLPPLNQSAGPRSNDLQRPADAGFGQRFGSLNRTPSFNGRSGYRI